VRTRGDAIELEADDDSASDTSADKNVTAVRMRGFRLALPAKSGPVAVPGRSSTGVAGSGITDPSYVFFKTIPAKTDGPSGALGTPLQPGHSIAVDPRSIPLGYPVFVSTSLSRYGAPMQRLLMAQDTSSAVSFGFCCRAARPSPDKSRSARAAERRAANRRNAWCPMRIAVPTIEQQGISDQPSGGSKDSRSCAASG